MSRGRAQPAGTRTASSSRMAKLTARDYKSSQHRALGLRGVREFCWGALWTRPGMDKRTRSIVNLAMLGALNRPHELKLHVKGALKNGLTKDEIKEILLQVAVYCGVPSGIDAFRNAREAFNEVEAK